MNIRGNYQDLFDTTMLPAINAVLWQQFKKKPKMFDKLFTVDTSTRSIEQYTQVSGTGLFGEITAEGGGVSIDQPVQGYDSTFRAKTFGLGVEFSPELIEDDKFGLVRKATAALADSADESLEIDTASIFNNGFSGSYLGPDGVCLFSASHPLFKVGGLQTNTLAVAADLDVTSLELALTDWELTKQSNGHQMRQPTPKLLVAAQNRWNAHEITKGSWRSDSANRTVNAFQYGENGPVDEVLVWSKLTDPDAWFLVAPPDSNGLIFLWRIRPENHRLFDERTLRAGTWMRYRKSQGWNDYPGSYGVPGA